jgi:hypothetical protein
MDRINTCESSPMPVCPNLSWTTGGSESVCVYTTTIWPLCIKRDLSLIYLSPEIDPAHRNPNIILYFFFFARLPTIWWTSVLVSVAVSVGLYVCVESTTDPSIFRRHPGDPGEAHAKWVPAAVMAASSDHALYSLPLPPILLFNLTNYFHFSSEINHQ